MSLSEVAEIKAILLIIAGLLCFILAREGGIGWSIAGVLMMISSGAHMAFAEIKDHYKSKLAKKNKSVIQMTADGINGKN